MTEGHDRFISIDYFVKDMLGMKNREWYYRHVKDPGFPQRIYVAGQPRLSFRDCLAYQERMRKGTQPPEPLKRNVGRPRKVTLSRL